MNSSIDDLNELLSKLSKLSLRGKKRRRRIEHELKTTIRFQTMTSWTSCILEDHNDFIAEEQCRLATEATVAKIPDGK